MAPDAASTKEYLVITATGPDQVGLVEAFTNAVMETGCNIEQSRMAVLGGQFAFLVLVQGMDAALEQLTASLGPLAERLGLSIVHRRTHRRVTPAALVPYAVEVVAMDHPGIVHNLARFFAGRGINIEELETETYPAPHTGTQMFAVHITVGVPADTSLKALRNEFLAHCDALNLDGSLEPLRD